MGLSKLKDTPDAVSVVDTDDSSHDSISNVDPSELLDVTRELSLPSPKKTTPPSANVTTQVKNAVLSRFGLGNNNKSQNDDECVMTVKGIFGNKEEEDERPFFRPRLKTLPLDAPPLEELQNSVEGGYDTAQFVPGYGLVNTFFWHTWFDGDEGALLEERAILFQSTEHYDAVSNHPTFGQYVDTKDTPVPSKFGEQVVISGCDSSRLAVGDIFEVEDGSSTLMIEVTSPRVPSSYVDQTYGAPQGLGGLSRHCLTNGLAGWFTRVLEAGELRDGMKLTRVHRPHPKFTLKHISKVLYGEGDLVRAAKLLPHWDRGRRELAELAALPQLGLFQWRTEAEKLLKEMDRLESQKVSLSRLNLNIRGASRSILHRNTPTLTVRGVFGRRGPYVDVPPAEASKVNPDRMPRRRLKTMPLNYEKDLSLLPAEGGNFENAWFVPGRGLVDHYFYHEWHVRGLLEERAVLFQSMESYDAVSNHPEYGKYLEDEDVMENPTFGEQVIVEGIDVCDLCVGDVFEVENGLSDLVVEITSPRAPCFHVDDRHSTPRGLKGMKRHAMTNALAGWFTRVIQTGELRDGMRLVRTRCPNPKYTLTFLSKILYGEGNRLALARGVAHWERSKNELEKLCSLPQLGRYEWKREAEDLLEKMEEEENEKKKGNKK